MTNTTPTFWEAQGQSLQTFARNLDTFEGRLLPASMRGSDIVIPYQPGETYVPKVVGSRILTLRGWVRATDPDGVYPNGSAAKAALFDENWRALTSLLWTPGRQFQLKKRFNVAGEVRSATALAEFVGGLAPTMIGRNAARFTVDLKLADTYFYDDILVTTPLVNGNQNVTVLGDAVTNVIDLSINGARDEVTIRNNTLGMELQYNADILTGDLVEIDVKKYRSVTTPDGQVGFKSNATILHSGSPQWLGLAPGVNQINLASDFGTGLVSMRHRGAWL